MPVGCLPEDCVHKTDVQPLVQSLPTYVKDSTHALGLIVDINQNPNIEPKCLFTMDVTSQYTCIPHSVGLKALEHFLNLAPTYRYRDPSCGTGLKQEHIFFS